MARVSGDAKNMHPLSRVREWKTSEISTSPENSDKFCQNTKVSTGNFRMAYTISKLKALEKNARFNCIYMP